MDRAETTWFARNVVLRSGLSTAASGEGENADREFCGMTQLDDPLGIGLSAGQGNTVTTVAQTKNRHVEGVE